jgi:16S rRNA (guanine527-N7)-methyltransferase
MDTTRIATLLAPYLTAPLSPSQLAQISTYIDLLQRWNARVNLTAIRHEEEIVTRHFGESLFLARHLFSRQSSSLLKSHLVQGHTLDKAECTPALVNSPVSLGADVRALDLGSGAGFPAIPLKIWAPDIALTLIESNHKKAAFLSEVARSLAFTNVNVIAERAEAVAPRLAGHADVVTLRAVERFQTILPQAASFLAPNGILALLITTTQLPHLTTLKELTWNTPIHIPESQTRVLSIGFKTRKW